MKLEDIQELSDEEIKKLSKEELIEILEEYITRDVIPFDDSKIQS